MKIRSVPLSFLVLFLSAVSLAATWDQRIIEVSTQRDLTLEDLVLRVHSTRSVILGEKHYTSGIQTAEATIAAALVKDRQLQSAFTLAWEFLSLTRQKKTDELFAQVVSGQIDAKAFLAQTQGTDSAQTYEPVINMVKDLQGHLIGVNLTREEKAPVVANGISGVDPKLLPPQFEMGGKDYFERFAEAANSMGNHMPPDKLNNYFAAQCLTDDVMAYQLLNAKVDSLRILIAGAFHTDYLEGTVARISRRDPNESLAVIRLMDASDYSDVELNSKLQEILIDPKYGKIADYVFFVNEPLKAEAGVSQ